MQDKVDLAFEFHCLCLCFVLTLEQVRKLCILSGCEDFKVIEEFMLKKMSKALAAWFLVYKYLGYRGRPVRCFFKKETVMALY